MARVGTSPRARGRRRAQVDPTEPTGSRGNPAKGKGGKGGRRLIRQSRQARVGTLRRAGERRMQADPTEPTGSRGNPAKGQKGEGGCRLTGGDVPVRLAQQQPPYSAPLRAGKAYEFCGSILGWKNRTDFRVGRGLRSSGVVLYCQGNVRRSFFVFNKMELP